MDECGFNVPAAFRFKIFSPRELKKNTRGLQVDYKAKAASKTEEMFKAIWMNNRLEQWAPTGKTLQNLRQAVMDKLLAPLGMDKFLVVQDVEGKAGREKLLLHELWPGGPKFADLSGDAMPNMLPFTIPTDKTHVTWDFHFTNYNPHFWPNLLKSDVPLTDRVPHRGSGVIRGRSAQGSSAGSNSDVPGSGGSKNHLYRGHDCDTKSFWVQYHGSNVYAVLSAVGQNFLSKSEAHKYDPKWRPDFTNKERMEWNKKQEDANKERYETAGAGRGVYTTQDFKKAVQYAVPLLLNKHWVKMVLLLAIPGDLADQGVAVNFKTTKQQMQTKQTGCQYLDKWTRIPKHIVVESAMRGFDQCHHARILKELHRWSGSHMTQQCDFVERRCPTLNVAMNEGRFQVFHHLERVKSKQYMAEDSREGEYGEEVWTVISLDGLEVVSSQVHVIGFFVGYTGYTA